MGIEIGRTSLSLEERVEFLRTFGGWLTSGGGQQPVHECLKNTCEVFSRDEYRSFEPRMERIVREYTAGRATVFEGLRGASLGFTFQEISIIEAAEKGNQLRVAIPSLVDALSMRMEATKALKRKLIPLLGGGFMLILMSLGVMIFMLPTVMGPVVERKEDALKDFPTVIQLYWYSSVWLRANPYAPIMFGLAPIVIFFMRNTAFMKPKVEKMLMAIAPTRRLILAYNSVMIVYFMPALVRAGIPVHEVLRTIAGSLNNIALAGALRVAANNHENGVRLGEALQVLPLRGSFRNAVEAGEKTGAIAERVEDLKTPFSNELERVSRRAVSAVTMIVMMILLPFFIMSMYTSLVAPIFALMEY